MLILGIDKQDFSESHRVFTWCRQVGSEGSSLFFRLKIERILIASINHYNNFN